MMISKYQHRFGCSSVAMITLVLGLSPASAQSEASKTGVSVNESLDRVWVQPSISNNELAPWFPASIRVVRGKILRFDSVKMEIIAEGATNASQLASERVIWIQPAGFESLEGPMVDLYRAGEFAGSLSKLPATLEQRPAIWRQQWITMLAANAAWKCRRTEISLKLVSQLDRRPLPPLVVAWLPIAWQRGVQSADAVKEAELFLSDSSEAVRLVAASWLLSSPKRGEAVAVIKQLISCERQGIATLAEALSWRAAAPPEIQSLASQWEQRLVRMPMVFQPGPMRALADLFEAAGLSADAKRLTWAMELTPINPAFGS